MLLIDDETPKLVKMVLTLPGGQRCRIEVRLGCLNMGSMEGGGVDVVEMMQRRRLEVLCVKETWRGDW